ncbi:MAG: DUF6503 family protein [Polaribacter sp.]
MRIVCFLSIIFFISCKPAKTKLTAEEIVNKSIRYSGAQKVANSEITFSFRNKTYIAYRKNGKFTLTRKFDSITDLLKNDGFVRFINKKEQKLPDSIANKYANSVNSVHYFSVLPFGLDDKAVENKLLPEVTIKGKTYYKIKVSFLENGGGEDFEDVFIYWIGKDNFLVDYLAYEYHTNGGGKRFRALKEQCVKNGIRFVDYYNYKPENKDIKLVDIDKAFEENKLKKVSEIVLKDINVKILEN